MKSLLLKSLIAFVLFVNFSTQVAQSQALDEWKTYMSYQDATMVAVDSKGYVYAVYKGYPYKNAVWTDGSLLRYDPSKNEIKTISKVNGLNDAHILRIAYVESQKILVIAYDNGNIDLYDTNKEGVVYNISDIKTNTSVSDKTVNGIDIYGDFAYLSMGLGIFAIDVKNKVLKDFYRIGYKTHSMCFWKGTDPNTGGTVDFLYAATTDGVKKAMKKSNLSSSSSWEAHTLTYTGSSPKNITKVLTFNDTLVFYQPTNTSPGTTAAIGIYYQSDPAVAPVKITTSPLPSITAAAPVNQMVVLNNKLIVVHNSANMYVFSGLKIAPTARPASGVVCVASLNNSPYWLARGYTGVSNMDKVTGSLGTPVTKHSPKRNMIFNMTYNQGKLLIVGGSMSITNDNHYGSLMVMESDDVWYTMDHSTVLTAMKAQIMQEDGVLLTDLKDLNCRDFANVIVDKEDPDHYYVAGYGEGLYEFKSNHTTKEIDFIKLHTQVNTGGALFATVQAFPNYYRYVRISGLTYDNGGNLHVTGDFIPNTVAIYKKDKTWTSIYDEKVTQTCLPIATLITESDQRWIISVRGAEWGGIYVSNGDNTISYWSNNFSDQDDKKLSISTLYCITKDLNGTIWVGSDIGPIVFYNPSSITAPGSTGFNRCSRIKMPKNDGTDNADYLLDGVVVTTIAVDAANRKWIGTSGSGVFLVNPTGDEVIANYTAENSPLLSNVIKKIVIGDDGKVFIGTEKGLISYVNLAVPPNPDYSKVYAYPNPVKPDFTGDVVVTGLMRDSNVKITDLSGNIMFQGASLGGQFAWNCKDRFGERVKTGVYLVFAATADGTQGVVSKIVVIK